MDPSSEERLAKALQRYDGVVFAYLFGSQATGGAGPRSDVDLAVHVEGPSEDAELDLHGIAASALHRDDVDVLVLNRAPLTLQFEALKGRLLFSLDEGARVEIEARIMSTYHDRLPYLRRHLALFAEDVRERGFA